MSRPDFALSLAAIAVVLGSLTGCGGKSSTDNGGNAGGTSNGGTSNGGSGNGGSGGVAICESHDDQSPISVTVELINKTTKTIYLGSQMTTCDVQPVFAVEDEQGKPLSSLGNCRQSCAVLRKQGAAGCPAICLFPSTIQLQPGEQYGTSWDSLYRVEASLPASCLPYDAGQPEVACDQAARIDPGTYVFKAIAGTAQDCSQTGGGMCAPCSMAADGSCTTPGSLIGGKLLNAQASVLLDEQYGYFKPVAPTSGSNSSSDAAPGALNQATVQLIFSE